MQKYETIKLILITITTAAFFFAIMAIININAMPSPRMVMGGWRLVGSVCVCVWGVVGYSCGVGMGWDEDVSRGVDCEIPVIMTCKKAGHLASS